MCHNQTLNELLKRRRRLDEIEIRCYLMQMISGVKYLHSHRIIHRDLKLGNLFLTDRMEEKIGDFGLATKLEFEGDKKRTICGTPNYIAPEIIDGKQGHSYEVDIWSIGVIIYTLALGKPPFETSEVKTTYKRIKMNAYTFPEHIRISSHIKDLITKILNLNPIMRPSLDDIMAHPFMSANGKIPKSLPASTLACKPSTTFIKEFTSCKESDEVMNLERTAQVSSGTEIKSSGNANLQNTQKVGLKSGTELKQSSSAIWVKKWVDYTSKYGLGI